MDTAGYPDHDELEKIRCWPNTDLRGLMEFVRQRWRYADVTYWVQKGNTYRLHTGGWSGNEYLISAMEAHPILWCIAWVSSRRGGHYVFRLPKGIK